MYEVKVFLCKDAILVLIDGFVELGRLISLSGPVLGSDTPAKISNAAGEADYDSNSISHSPKRDTANFPFLSCISSLSSAKDTVYPQMF